MNLTDWHGAGDPEATEWEQANEAARDAAEWEQLRQQADVKCAR